MENIGQQIASGLKDWLLATLLAWLHWATTFLLQTLGVTGIVTAIALCILLLAASGRTIRFFNSPQGLRVSAAVAAVGLACTWWLWPVPSVATVLPTVAEHTAPAQEPVVEEEPSAPPLLASEATTEATDDPLPEPAPVTSRPTVFDLPALGFVPAAPVMEVASLPPPPQIHTHAVGSAPATAPHHAARTSHPSTSYWTHKSAPVAVSTSRGAGFGQVGFSGNGRATPHHPTIHDWNAAAWQGQGPFAGMHGGGGIMHPGFTGGMHLGIGHAGHLGRH